MSDPQTPVLEAANPPAPDPVRYVSWVHFGDPGWRQAEPGVPAGSIAVAWALHLDGERVERNRGENVRGKPDDPWWTRVQAYRDRVTSWQASGGATDGTVVSFWVDAEAVEIDSADPTRLRIKVYGRDILAPLGYPLPAAPADTRYPVQVHMFVNRLTVGPMLDADAVGVEWE